MERFCSFKRRDPKSTHSNPARTECSEGHLSWGARVSPVARPLPGAPHLIPRALGTAPRIHGVDRGSGSSPAAQGQGSSHLGTERGRDSPKVIRPVSNSLETIAGRCPEPQEGPQFPGLGRECCRAAGSQESSSPRKPPLQPSSPLPRGGSPPSENSRSLSFLCARG